MKRLISIIFLFAVLAAAIFSYTVFFMPNINSEKRVAVKIPTGSSYKDMLRILREDKVLKSEYTFSLVTKLKHFHQVKPGYYVFSRNMNNRQIVNMLQMGLQTPVTLVVYNIRTKEEFAGLVGRTLEIDSNVFLAKLNSDTFCSRYKLNTDNILSRFIVDNYEFFWNTSLQKFLAKEEDAYDDFWNADRLANAAAIHLTPEQVTTLASIVEKEVIHDKELPTVAGVYLNRLKIGMPLQADPTLVFALRDFEARRVNSRHKEYDSPYNTYLHAGLPPGPICMPRKKSIDAVLNAETNEYLYFCASPDMSGYSLFTKTYEEQIQNAAKYRKKLDELNVH